jgi:hypothetical protein
MDPYGTDDIPPDGSPYADPSIHAHAKELHVHTALNVDGKTLARVTQKHIVARNRYVYGPSTFDGAALPSGVDHGMASAVAA